MKEKYGLGYHERLQLEARDDPRWRGEQGRLELVSDRDAEAFRVRQPVKDAVPRRDESLAGASSDEDAPAAVDIVANTLVACTVSTGHQRLYHARPEFERVRPTTEQSVALQERLPYGEWSSRHIRRLYRRRTERVSHLQDALVRDFAEWLHGLGVGEVVAGNLSGVLQQHWSAVVNQLGIDRPIRETLVASFTSGYSPLDPTQPDTGSTNSMYRLRINVAPAPLAATEY